MSNVITLHAPAAQGGFGFIDRLRGGVDAFRLYRRTLGELQGLTDRELADIGMSRLSIRDVARSAVYGA